MRARAEILLTKLESGKRAPEELRALRALEVLEMAGSVAWRKVLEELAAGAAKCELTAEAKAALERLSRRPERKP